MGGAKEKKEGRKRGEGSGEGVRGGIKKEGSMDKRNSWNSSQVNGL